MGDGRIAVLRLGHRPERDKRITTHVALVSRAFGAGSILVSTKDSYLEERVKEVSAKFGGSFSIQTGIKWKEFVRGWEGTIVHLTMYGMPLEEAVEQLPEDSILVVVGAEKVPSSIYGLADFNISVGNQPHSEVAALAIFLDRVTNSAWEKVRFEGKRRIIPSKRGKIVLDVEGGYLSREDCLTLLKERGCEEGIVEHAKVVARLAIKMAELCGANVDLVRTAAFLHDIGRSLTHAPAHGYEGGRILRELGFPDEVACTVERHVGGGLDAEEMKKLGLPAKDLIPVAIEEKIVCLADKMIDEDRKGSIGAEVQKLRDKGLDIAAKRVEELHRELTGLCGMDPEELDI
ncbi:MAG: HDIG domain-containing metalloprotein [Thermoplasmata archaeon]